MEARALRALVHFFFERQFPRLSVSDVDGAVCRLCGVQAVPVGARGAGADTHFRCRSNEGFVRIGAGDGCAPFSTAERMLRARPDCQRGKVMNLRNSASISAPR
jgi:hypothetical protein